MYIDDDIRHPRNLLIAFAKRATYMLLLNMTMTNAGFTSFLIANGLLGIPLLHAFMCEPL